MRTLLLLALLTTFLPSTSDCQAGPPNQRMQELQNRHNRRYHADWYPRRPSQNRAR